MAMTLVYCLHGFLGQPSDWNGLEESLRSRERNVQLVKVPLFDDAALGGNDSPAEWAKRFTLEVASVPSESNVRRFLVGYSLGGRLALHALLEKSFRWAGAVVVSCHSGLTDESDRTARRASDARWAARVLEEPWDSLMEAWNAQPVFGGTSLPFRREEISFSRDKIAAAFWSWSLGNQEDLLPRLPKIDVPVLWLTGARDSAYTEIAKRAATRAHSIQSRIIADAGHRLPWEAPKIFHELVSSFMTDSSPSTICKGNQP